MSENPNEKSAVTKGTLAAGFSVASVWFGTHVGAGFATGNQVLSYYVNYGWTAAIYPLISMGVLAYVIYVIMKFARLRGLDNYNDTFRELWLPYPQADNCSFHCADGRHHSNGRPDDYCRYKQPSRRCV